MGEIADDGSGVGWRSVGPLTIAVGIDPLGVDGVVDGVKIAPDDDGAADAVGHSTQALLIAHYGAYRERVEGGSSDRPDDVPVCVDPLPVEVVVAPAPVAPDDHGASHSVTNDLHQVLGPGSRADRNTVRGPEDFALAAHPLRPDFGGAVRLVDPEDDGAPGAVAHARRGGDLLVAVYQIHRQVDGGVVGPGRRDRRRIENRNSRENDGDELSPHSSLRTPRLISGSVT